MSFSGRAIAITGGSSGLGLALATELAAQGAELTLIARDQARLEAAAGPLGAQAIAVDVSDEPALKQRLAQLDRLDIVINSAGVLREGYFEELPDAVFREVMEINLFGAINVIRATLPLLKRSRGSIVNIASAAGLMGVFGYTPYAAAKHALVGFSDSLRYELEPQGVSVLLVCPGEFDSPMISELEQGRTPENRVHTLSLPKTPLASIVRETLRGIEAGRPLIVPGAAVRVGVLAGRLAPALTRAVGRKRIRAVYRGPADANL